MKTKYAFRFHQQLADSDMQAIAEEYKKNYLLVSGHIKTLESINLAEDYEIIYKPEDYFKYLEIVTDAQARLGVFTGSTWNHMKTIPSLIKADQMSINLLFNSAFCYLQTLIKFPQELAIRNVFNEMLQLLITCTNPEIILIEQLQQDLKNCKGKFAEVSELLLDIVNRAKNDEQIDQNKVVTLQKDIERLENLIDDLTTALDASGGIAAIACLCLEVVRIFPMRPKIKKRLSIAFGVIGGIAFASEVADYIALCEEQKRLEQDADLLNDIEQDIVQLQMIADDFTRYASDTNALQPCFTQMLDVWNAFGEDIEAIATGIKNIEENENSVEKFTAEYWTSIYEEMKALQADYNTYAENAELFNVDDIEGRHVELNLNMSPEEATAAVSAAESVELIEYLIA